MISKMADLMIMAKTKEITMVRTGIGKIKNAIN